MITYFCIYSFLGYLMESTYISFFEKKWYSSGLLDGPYIPLYGFGAIVLIVITPFVQSSCFLTFISGSLLMTALEYFTSIYLEKVFHRNIWDYSQYRYNYHGRICIFYSLLWGIIAVILIYFIHPYLSSILPSNITSLFLSVVMIIIIMKDTLLQFNKKHELT